MINDKMDYMLGSQYMSQYEEKYYKQDHGSICSSQRDDLSTPYILTKIQCPVLLQYFFGVQIEGIEGCLTL